MLCSGGAFDLHGNALWSQGEGGNQPSRPLSVAVHDFDGDGAAEVLCFWHRPRPGQQTDWQTLADVVVQIRDGRTGEVVREAAPLDESAYTQYAAGPQQYNPRLMD